MRFFACQCYQRAAVASGERGHARLQGHVEVSGATPGGQIQDEQRKGPALQQFDGRSGGQLRFFGEDHHQMSQIDPGSGQVGGEGRGFGIAHPGHPLARALAFQQQLQGRAEVAATLTGQLDQPAFDIKFGHASTVSGVHQHESSPCFVRVWEASLFMLLRSTDNDV